MRLLASYRRQRRCQLYGLLLLFTTDGVPQHQASDHPVQQNKLAFVQTGQC
jgi:hypothetical protein